MVYQSQGRIADSLESDRPRGPRAGRGAGGGGRSPCFATNADSTGGRLRWSCVLPRRWECSKVVAICHESGIGVVPQGATPVTAVAQRLSTVNGQILLSFARMNRIREFDTINQTMTVEAGLILAQAHAAAEAHGLHVPLSMGSEGSLPDWRRAFHQCRRCGRVALGNARGPDRGYRKPCFPTVRSFRS